MISFVNFAALSDIDKVNALAAISQTVAAVLSLVALMLSIWVFSRQQRMNRWQLRLQREDHIIDWARQALHMMAAVEEQVRANAELGGEVISRDDAIHHRAQISAVIDEGRLYFPNIQDPAKGRDKAEAYRGHRQPILDALVAYYDWIGLCMTGMSGEGENAVVQLNKLRRTFVSCVQESIDPRRFNRVSA